jgi:hypothetical protein
MNKRIWSPALIAGFTLLAAATAHAAAFCDNTGPTTVSGYFGGDHEIADDVPFTGSHTISGFTILYHATVAVNATFKFYTVNASTGRLGSTVATFTTSNLAVGDHVFTMNLAPAQQFTWTACRRGARPRRSPSPAPRSRRSCQPS